MLLIFLRVLENAIAIAVFTGILNLGVDISAQIADRSQLIGADPTGENLIGAGPHVEIPALVTLHDGNGHGPKQPCQPP